MELPFVPPMRGDFYLVPNGVRPVLQRTGLEVGCDKMSKSMASVLDAKILSVTFQNYFSETK